MNILFYIPDLDQLFGGVRQYSLALLKMLQKDLINTYFIYHDKGDPDVLATIADIPNCQLITTQQIIVRPSKATRYRAKFYNRSMQLFHLKKRIVFPDTITAYCYEKNIDIIHCPYQFIPFVKNVKLITTLHDVQELHYPEFFSAEARAHRATMYLDFIRRADLIFVSYNHVKNDLVKYFSVSEQKIRTIFLQMDKLWFEKFSEKDMVDLPVSIQSKPFLLYPANAWPHKNHLKLLEALAWLRDNEKLDLHMVFTGDTNFDHGKIVFERVKALQLSDSVDFLGIVDSRLLYSLYKKTVAVVIPTLYEAGSFPLMESIFLGIPVICSDVTSLGETVGDKSFTFNPTNVKSIATKIKELYEDESFRKRSVQNSVMQVDKLINTNALQNILDSYSSLA